MHEHWAILAFFISMPLYQPSAIHYIRALRAASRAECCWNYGWQYSRYYAHQEQRNKLRLASYCYRLRCICTHIAPSYWRVSRYACKIPSDFTMSFRASMATSRSFTMRRILASNCIPCNYNTYATLPCIIYYYISLAFELSGFYYLSEVLLRAASYALLRLTLPPSGRNASRHYRAYAAVRRDTYRPALFY